MRCIADEDDLAGELFDARDLSEDTAGVEHRLANEHPIVGSFVDQNAFAKRIQVEIHDVADQEAAGDTCGVVAQRAQAACLGFERVVTLQLEIRQPQFRLEFGLVGAQCFA